MASLLRSLGCLCFGIVCLSGLGCEQSPSTSPPAASSEHPGPEEKAKDDHDHADHKHGDKHDDHAHADHKDDHDHDHADHKDEHKKGDDAKHDDHDHADKDHEDHDHADHDHEKSEHKTADTYAAAVDEIERLRKSIKTGFDEKKLKEADEAVHEVGHVLETVTKLAAKASLSAEDQALVKKHVEDLFTAFGKIDEKLHGAVGSDYNEVAKEIEAAIEVLKSKIPAASPPTTEPAAEKHSADKKHSEDEKKTEDEKHSEAETKSEAEKKPEEAPAK